MWLKWTQATLQNASDIGYNRTYLGYYNTDLMAYQAHKCEPAANESQPNSTDSIQWYKVVVCGSVRIYPTN